MSELIISVSGLRGIVGQNLDPLVVARYAAAFARQAPPGPMIVARDGRTTGPMLRDALTAALRAAGRDVIDADVAATPTVGVLVRHLEAAGAVQVSASHNPPAYNGMKLFGPDGRVLAADKGAAIQSAFIHDPPQWQSFDRIGVLCHEPDPHAPHLEKVLATVDATAIAKQQFRVLLDSNHGAGALLGQRLLQGLGCQVVLLGECPDGKFAHPPEPTAENLQTVAQQVRQHGCHVGFCQDPDADRLALIDADGRYVGEEKTVALCVQRMLEYGSEKGPIVINCATSSMSQWLADQASVACLRSAVGEANVADLMIAEQACYGGEGNGGPIDPRVGYVRDSFVGMAQVLDLMQRTGASLAELTDRLPAFAIHKTTVRIAPNRLPAILDSLPAHFADGQPDRSDGLRIAWDDAWLLIRGSNTEPIVRLIAEADTAQAAASLCAKAAALVQEDPVP